VDNFCIDVIRQIHAVEAALNKVSSKILEDHLNSCVITAIQGSDKKERERILKEITEVFEMSMKV
jgi:DNA-binding FrmR family transcriptional regulator